MLRNNKPLLTICALGCFGLGIGLGFAIGSAGNRTILAASTALPDHDFTSIARRATPAVVNISAVQIYRTQRSPFFSDPFFQFFGGDLPFRVPIEERKTSLGSGVLVSPDGLIVTNHHVVERARQITITTADRRRHTGELIGSDPTTDIAVLRINARNLPYLSWGGSDLAVGEYVLAVGNPFQLSQTVTMGIVSATGRSNLGIVDYEDFIQTDAAINPGNSGGALVNTRGELVGINTAIYSETGGYQGIGFAVPASLARKVVGQIAANGRVRRGFVGITKIADLDDETAARLGLRATRGAVVWELLRGSPADRAGVEPGDVVVEVGGVTVNEAAQLRNAIAGAEVGSELLVTVLREGRRRELRILVEESQRRS